MAATYGAWSRTVAAEEGAPWIDLNELVAWRYDEPGPEAVLPLFADEHTHTSRAGAELNAALVADALRAVPGLGGSCGGERPRPGAIDPGSKQGKPRPMPERGAPEAGAPAPAESNAAPESAQMRKAPSAPRGWPRARSTAEAARLPEALGGRGHS